MSPRSIRRSFSALLAVMAFVLSACSRGTLPQNVLDPQGPIARKLHYRLWVPTFSIAVVMFFLVELGILFIVFRYRARSDEDAPKQVHGSSKLEIGWTIAPALILAVVGVLTVSLVFESARVASGEEVVNVKLIGHQWWWEYQYPDQGVVTANELHIPVGRTVQLSMTSADVIHSYWVPKLNGKVDVVPGHNNHLQLKATKAGEYWGQCTEYCGLSHGYMRLRVIAQEESQWNEWVARQVAPAVDPPAANADAVAGKALVVAKGCPACHTINGYEGVAGKVGPNLTHLASRGRFAGASFDINERNLRQWLRDPPAMKPMRPSNGQGMPNLGLSEDDITKLIAYLETLK